MTIYDELVRGCFDLHCHVDVEFSTSAFRKRGAEWSWLPAAEAAGVAGYVLKSHLWPSVTLLPALAELYTGSVQVLGSVTLNPVCGGVDPFPVEAAVALGARAVFLPTWGAANDRSRRGFSRRLGSTFNTFDTQRHSVATVVDEDGALTPAMSEVLGLCLENEIMLGTGHVSWQESLAIAREAERIGFRRLVFSHPLSNSVGAPREAIAEIASLGAYVELCWTSVAPGRTSPAEAVELIRAIGVEQMVAATDYFRGSTPVPHELMRMFLGELYDAGLRAEEVRQIAAVNPSQVVTRQ